MESIRIVSYICIVVNTLRKVIAFSADPNYIDNRIYLATDPFALDLICHNLLVAKRKAMGVTVNENPRFTEYLRYAERLGLGVADLNKIKHVRV